MLSMISNLLFPVYVRRELKLEIFDEFRHIFDFADCKAVLFDEPRKEYMGCARYFLGVYEMQINWEHGMHMALLAMAHEFVHFDQFRTKRLQLQAEYDGVSFSRYYFEGKMYDTSVVKYADRPWEHEAYRMESLMLQSFVSSCNGSTYSKICKHLTFADRIAYGKHRRKAA